MYKNHMSISSTSRDRDNKQKLLSNLVQIGLLRSIWSTSDHLVYFDPIWSNLVHYIQFVPFNSIQSIKFNSVCLGPLQSISSEYKLKINKVVIFITLSSNPFFNLASGSRNQAQLHLQASKAEIGKLQWFRRVQTMLTTLR